MKDVMTSPECADCGHWEMWHQSWGCSQPSGVDYCRCP
ncbi:hypothetical protein LCGC14_2950920, partial [marine sediment metagenome]